MPISEPRGEHVSTTVQAYVDARMCDHQKLHDAENRAVCAANDAMSARFDGVNEFRSALSDQAGKFVTRDVVDAIHKAQTDRTEFLARNLDSRIDDMRESVQRSAIAAGVAGGVLGMIGGVALAIMTR